VTGWPFREKNRGYSSFGQVSALSYLCFVTLFQVVFLFLQEIYIQGFCFCVCFPSQEIEICTRRLLISETQSRRSRWRVMGWFVFFRVWRISEFEWFPCYLLAFRVVVGQVSSDGVVRCHGWLLFPLLEGFRIERIFLCGSMSASQVFSVFEVFFDVYFFSASGKYVQGVCCFWDTVTQV